MIFLLCYAQETYLSFICFKIKEFFLNPKTRQFKKKNSTLKYFFFNAMTGCKIKFLISVYQRQIKITNNRVSRFSC